MPTALQPKFAGNEPSLADALLLSKLDTFASMNCVRVGQIILFDSTQRTAQVKILGVRVLPDGTNANYPPLADCPVFTLQGGGAYLSFPIAPGDECLVLFNDRNLDAWFSTGGTQPPQDARMHDFSDGIVLVGLNSIPSVLASYTDLQATFSYGGAQVALAAGLVKISNATTTLLTILNSLITVIEGLQVNGPIPLTSDSIAALEAQKLILATLLS